MNKIVVVLLAVVLVSCKKDNKTIQQNLTLKSGNAKQFHQKITSNNGIWVNKIKDTVSPFGEFIMDFENKADTLFGTIYGVHKKGDTIRFWDIREYFDHVEGKYYTEQNGPTGHSLHQTFFDSPLVRKAEFIMSYIDSTEQKIRDEHLFMNDSILISKSEIFDEREKIWIKQPDAIWKKN